MGLCLLRFRETEKSFLGTREPRCWLNSASEGNLLMVTLIEIVANLQIFKRFFLKDPLNSIR